MTSPTADSHLAESPLAKHPQSEMEVDKSDKNVPRIRINNLYCLIWGRCRRRRGNPSLSSWKHFALVRLSGLSRAEEGLQPAPFMPALIPDSHPHPALSHWERGIRPHEKPTQSGRGRHPALLSPTLKKTHPIHPSPFCLHLRFSPHILAINALFYEALPLSFPHFPALKKITLLGFWKKGNNKKIQLLFTSILEAGPRTFPGMVEPQIIHRTRQGSVAGLHSLHQHPPLIPTK